MVLEGAAPSRTCSPRISPLLAATWTWVHGYHLIAVCGGGRCEGEYDRPAREGSHRPDIRFRPSSAVSLDPRGAAGPGRVHTALHGLQLPSGAVAMSVGPKQVADR